MTSDNAVNDLKIRLTNLMAKVYRLRAAKSLIETIEGEDEIGMLRKYHKSLVNRYISNGRVEFALCTEL